MIPLRLFGPVELRTVARERPSLRVRAPTRARRVHGLRMDSR
jgi:hypothetical protein